MIALRNYNHLKSYVYAKEHIPNERKTIAFDA